MRFYSIVKDRAGHFHRSMTRAPDLYRREISAATGSGTLIFCSMLPDGVCARDIDCHLEVKFPTARIDGRSVLIGNEQAILVAMHHVTHFIPRRLSRYRMVKRFVKSLMLTASDRLRSS